MWETLQVQYIDEIFIRKYEYLLLKRKDSHDLCVGFLDELAKSATIVEGEFEIGNQYHVYMETLSSLCIPTEDGMEVYCTSQDVTAVQSAVASCLNLRNCQLVVVLFINVYHSFVDVSLLKV